MYIVLSTDNNFVQHCAVTIISILRNNVNVTFYVLTEGLSKENSDLLKEIVTLNNGIIYFKIVDHSITDKLPMPKGDFLRHISVATYYRLFVTSLLPNDLKKVLYLDCDIVVRHSLEELWALDLNDYALGAVYQDDPQWISNETYNRLGINPQNGYFNAGVLLINLEYWRKNNVEKLLLDYVGNNYSNIKFHDQDTLNAVLNSFVLMLPCKWNVLTYFLEAGMNRVVSWRCKEYQVQLKNGVSDNPAIVHYVSRPKPWEYSCNHPFVKDYFYYLDMTQFNGWRPKFSLKSLIEYRIKPYYIVIKHQIKLLLIER